MLIEKCLTIREDERNKTSHAMVDDRKHIKIDKFPDKIEPHGIIGRFNRKKILNTYKMQLESEMTSETNIAPSNEEEILCNPHPTELEDAIRSRRVVAATDVPMDRNLMASHWMLKSLENQIRIEGGVEITKWKT